MDNRPFAYAMIKPQGMQIREQIINKLHSVGDVVHASRTFVDRNIMAAHYASKSDKPYYKSIVDYMSGKQVERLIIQGDGSPAELITSLRQLAGYLKPLQAEDGTIRRMAIENKMPHIMVVPQEDRNLQQFAYDNLIHTSDSFAAAIDEIRLWFPDQPEVVEAAYRSYLSNDFES